jgi:hypothetical protein
MDNTKAVKYKRLMQIGIIGVVGLVVAPVIFLAVKGIVGLVIAGVVGGIALALMPAVSEKLTQLKFQAMKIVISRAPVESLYARVQERHALLQEQRGVLQEQAANLESFKKKATKFMEVYPEEAASYQEKLTGYEKLFAFRVNLFKEAKAKNMEFVKVVEKAEAIYEMAVADAALGNSFNKEQDFMAFYREKTAFDAIERADNLAMSNLRMALVDDDVVNKLSAETTINSIHKVSYDPQGNVILGDILNTVPEPAVIRR